MASTPASSNNLLEPVRWLGWRHDDSLQVSFREYEPEAQRRLTTDLGVLGQDKALEGDSLRFIQSWWTFGLVQSFLQQSVSTDVLLSGHGSEAILTLDKLPSILDDLTDRIGKGTESPMRNRWFKQATQDLLGLRDALELVRNGDVTNGEIKSIPSNLLCFVLQLAETLSMTLFELAGQDTDLMPSAKLLKNWSRFSWSVYKAFKSILLSRGQCPRAVACVKRLSLVSAWVYASTTSMLDSYGDHSMCTPAVCKTLDLGVTQGGYGTVHRKRDCNCAMITPDFECVVDVLRNGDVPAFVFRTEEKIRNESKLSVCNSSGVGYCAISHVWAEGLGSVTEVGLPACQLQFIQEKVGDQPFWIDALGVPEVVEYRKKAILLMADTYKRAQSVLVLDASLSRCADTASETEFLFRLYVSSWTSRLWTFQEALLARDLLLATKDSNKPFLDILGPTFKLNIRSPLLIALCDNLMLLVPSLTSVSFADNNNMVPLRALSTQLRNRSTSRPADETLAIAAIAGVDLVPLLELSRSQRMVNFLKQLRSLPRDIIFGRIRRWSDEPGFSWAPRSFMQPFVLEGAPTATCSDIGLQCQYTVVSLGARRTIADRTFRRFPLLVDGVRQLVQLGLVRDGETDEHGSKVTCDALILTGMIRGPMGSCSATAITWKSEPATGIEDVTSGTMSPPVPCKFESAGFTLIWGVNNDDVTAPTQQAQHPTTGAQPRLMNLIIT